MGRWAHTVEIILTFSPLISTFTFDLILLLYSFHNRSIHRTCFIVTAQLPIESDSHNVPLCFETNSLTLGPLLSGNLRLYHKTHVDCVFSEHTGRQAFNKQICKHLYVAFILQAFLHNSGLSHLQRITLCQCVWRQHLTHCHRREKLKMVIVVVNHY